MCLGWLALLGGGDEADLAFVVVWFKGGEGLAQVLFAEDYAAVVGEAALLEGEDRAEGDEFVKLCPAKAVRCRGEGRF